MEVIIIYALLNGARLGRVMIMYCWSGLRSDKNLLNLNGICKGRKKNFLFSQSTV